MKLNSCIAGCSIFIACTSSQGTSGQTPGGTDVPPPKVTISVGADAYSGSAAGLSIVAPNASSSGYAEFVVDGGSVKGLWRGYGRAALGDLGRGDVTVTIRNTFSDEVGAGLVSIVGREVDAGSVNATSGTITFHFNDDGTTFSGTATCVPASMSATFSGKYTATCYPAGAVDAGSVPTPDPTWSTDFCKSFLSRRGIAP